MNGNESFAETDDLTAFASIAGLDAAVLAELLPSPAALQRDALEPRSEDQHLQVARAVAHLMIGRPDDGLEAVVSLLADGRIEVAEYSIRWEGHTPMVRRRLDVAVLIDLMADSPERTAAVVDAVTSVRRRRRKRFRRCSRCDVLTPPEWWSSEGHCQTCAERYRGAVH